MMWNGWSDWTIVCTAAAVVVVWVLVVALGVALARTAAEQDRRLLDEQRWLLEREQSRTREPAGVH